MKKNIDTKGRLFRLACGIFYLILAIVTYPWSIWVSLILLFFSLLGFYQALTSWCVVYYFLGIDHCPVDIKKKDKDTTKKEEN